MVGIRVTSFNFSVISRDNDFAVYFLKAIKYPLFLYWILMSLL